MGRFSFVRNTQNKIKKEILDKILSNDDLLKYIHYPTSQNPLSEKNIKDPYSMLNKTIFKIPKDTDVMTAESVVLILQTRCTKGRTQTIRNMEIKFQIISNIQCMDNLANGDDRILCIADLIDESIFDTRGSWLGRVEYQDDYPFSVNKSHTGLAIIYKVSDFA